VRLVDLIERIGADAELIGGSEDRRRRMLVLVRALV